MAQQPDFFDWKTEIKPRPEQLDSRNN